MIILNKIIKQIEKEVRNNNFEKALEMMEGIECDGEDKFFISLLKIDSLMGLNKYDEALIILNPLISDDPYDPFLWSCKVKCHYFGDDKVRARKSLEEFKRLVDINDKKMLVYAANLCNLLDDYENALYYCNSALHIDAEYFEAINVKALVASHMGDKDLMSDCADELLKIREPGMINLMLPFVLKLFAGKFRDSRDIVNQADDLDDNHRQMLLAAIYNVMSNDLGVGIRTDMDVDVNFDDALDVLMVYHEHGVEAGIICGARYFIDKSNE